MRTFVIAAAAAGIALAGCTSKTTVVEPAGPAAYQPPPSTTGAPRIAYTVMGQEQDKEAAAQAASWCNSNYGSSGAHLVDRSRGTTGDIVTYECTMS